jgi:putative transposase
MSKTKDAPRKTLPAGIGKVLKRLHYPLDVIVLCVRWYMAYSPSLRNLEEMILLRAHRDKAAARRYSEKAIDQNGEPETITVDKSGANLAALEALNAERSTPIKVRQNKYLNNIVEQDHRAIKRIIKPMMGFKNFRCARIILAGIELNAHDSQGADAR